MWCSPRKLLLKITILVRKNGSSWGQGFEPHTFQVSFDPLMLLNLPITYRAIYTHLKLYSGCKKSQKNILGLRAIQPLCTVEIVMYIWPFLALRNFFLSKLYFLVFVFISICSFQSCHLVTVGDFNSRTLGCITSKIAHLKNLSVEKKCHKWYIIWKP